LKNKDQNKYKQMSNKKRKDKKIMDRKMWKI
jgi:hypothetical protein